MITIPEPISVSFGFDTLLTCEMNIEPDKFQWKFYPTDDPFNPNSVINLSNSTFHLVREEKYTRQRKKSSLTVQVSKITSFLYKISNTLLIILLALKQKIYHRAEDNKKH